MNYYNEIDPFAASWLRELIKAGLIPDGHVDERSIKDVKGKDSKKMAKKRVDRDDNIKRKRQKKGKKWAAFVLRN